MGEMADYYVDRMIYGGPRGRRGAYGPPVRCNNCGSTDVFWQKLPGDKYELRDVATHEKHVCPTSADGFGDCDDA